MNGCCQILSNAFSASNKMIICVFVLELVFIVDYIDGFPYIKPCLHPWNETYLVSLDDCLDVFLDSVSKNFIEDFYIDIHKGNCSDILYLSWVFMWFRYQSNCGFYFVE